MNAIQTVLAWHEALNAGDIDRLVALCREDVRVGGPRGSGSGHDLLREWFARAGLQLQARRVFHRPGGDVVVEQLATWPGTEPATVASSFSLDEGTIATILRYDDLRQALATSELSESDLVST
jgi:hypothetical protein